VIRTNGPNAPGIGIAAWLGQRRSRPYDLSQRISFFKSNPCPIQTLILLRDDGKAALGGEALAEFEKAVKAGRDVRVHKYEPKHLHALMAFAPWHQVALAELQLATETDPTAETLFRELLADLSNDLLAWVDAWRQPLTVMGVKV
jgi:hypothetical protein